MIHFFHIVSARMVVVVVVTVVFAGCRKTEHKIIGPWHLADGDYTELLSTELQNGDCENGSSYRYHFDRYYIDHLLVLGSDGTSYKERMLVSESMGEDFCITGMPDTTVTSQTARGFYRLEKRRLFLMNTEDEPGIEFHMILRDDRLELTEVNSGKTATYIR